MPLVQHEDHCDAPRRGRKATCCARQELRRAPLLAPSAKVVLENLCGSHRRISRPRSDRIRIAKRPHPLRRLAAAPFHDRTHPRRAGFCARRPRVRISSRIAALKISDWRTSPLRVQAPWACIPTSRSARGTRRDARCLSRRLRCAKQPETLDCDIWPHCAWLRRCPAPLLFPQFIDTESTWGLKSIGQPFAKGSVLKYAKPPVGEIAVYASFWIMIACGKAVANYYYLFLPMRGPSLELYNRTIDSGRDGYERGFAGVNLALAWLSVLAMFFVDGQLWFSVFCSIFGFIGGVIKGMKRWRVADAVTRLPLSLIGKWNSDRRLHADFVRSCALFKKKCSAKPDVTIARPLVKHGVRADIPTTSAGALPVRSFDTGEEKERSARWASYGAIASAWNGVIEELFMGDLVSSEEAKNLCFWCPNACPPKSTSSRVRRLLSSNATRMRQYFSIATTNRNYFFLPIFLLSGSDRTAPVWRLCRSGPTETHLAASSDFSRAISYFLESVFLRGRAESFHVTVVRPAMFLSRNQDASFSTGFSKRLCAVFDAAEAVAVSASARTDDFIAATVHFLNFIPSFWTASASSLDAHKRSSKAYRGAPRDGAAPITKRRRGVLGI